MMQETNSQDIINQECSSLCPFKLKACLDICEKLTGAIKNTTSAYPCAAIKMCPPVPQVDEYGELPR